MKGRIIIILMMGWIGLSAQWIDPWQIRPAPDSNMIIGAKGVYNEADWVYVDSLGLGKSDSIFLRNDTIFLKNGSGFVKIPTVGGSSLTAGQTVTVQTLISGDTLFAGVNTNSLDSTHIKAGSIARNDLSFTIDESKWTQSGSNLYPKVIGSNIGVNTTNPLYKLDVSGDLRVTSRTGSAIVGAGFDSNGKLVEYNLDTAIMIPETYINSGTDINVTGNGAFATPYVITNTQIHQDLFPHSTGFILSNPTPTLQDTVIFQYSSSVIDTPPTGCNCGILDIPNLQTTLDGKALTSHTHTIANVTGLQSAIDAKENSFSKGSIIQGTGVTLSGTLTNRLVGSGDVIINAAGGGVTLSEAINPSIVTFSNTTTVLSITLTAGTYKLDALCTIYNETNASNIFGITLRNSTTATNLFASSGPAASLEPNTYAAARNITIASTNTIVVNASTVVDAAILPHGCILTALKIN